MATINDLNRVNDIRRHGLEIPGETVFNLDPPGACDVCVAQPAVVDGKTVQGPWANMCLGCFRDVGVGLGVGRGQVFLNLPH